MSGGGAYQARVVALLGAYALAESDAQPPLSLTSPLEEIACETDDPVDDVVVRTINGYTAAIQVKRTVRLNRRRAAADGTLTPLASAIDQFVRQYHLARKRALSDDAAELDPTYDRLVLAVGSGSPATVRQTLAGVLDRIRSQPSGNPLLSSVLNRVEREAVETLLEHARKSWEEATGSRPSDTDLHEFLRLVWVQTLSVEEGEADERIALTLLRSSVVENSKDAHHAWSVLIEIGSRLSGSRSSIAVPQIRSTLAKRGIPLRGTPSYRKDIDRLRRHTVSVVDQLAEHTTVPIGKDRVRIDRPYAAVLRKAAESGSVLVFGEPGIGKSGVIHDLAKELLDEGRRVVVLTPQSPAFSSLPQLRDALQLEHDITDVLENWTGQDTGFLIIDALDAARTISASEALRQLIEEVQQATGRWRVIASVREYDARYSRELHRLFHGEPPSSPHKTLSGIEFSQIRHILVDRLSDSELDQLATSARKLHTLVTTAPPSLSHLFRTPFNLRIAGELLADGIVPDTIREVHSQLELLDLYWKERVLDVGELRESYAREVVLEKVVREMIERRSLRATTQDVVKDTNRSGALTDLLSAQVLMEWRPDATRVPDRYTLTFAHHVLFDYAVMRVWLPRDPARLANLLASAPDLILLVRPSIDMYFHDRWIAGPRGDRQEFWEAAMAVAEASGIPEIGKLLGPSVAAQLIRSLADAEPLLHSLQAPDPATCSAAEDVFNHLLQSVTLLLKEGEEETAVPIAAWCALLERVSRNLTDGTAYPTRTLLWDLTERGGELDSDQLSATGVASRRLLEFAWARSPHDRHLVARALQYVCRTFASDPEDSAKLLRRAIAPDHLTTFGSDELFWIASEVEGLATFDPCLVRDIYTAAFSHTEESEEPSPMGGVVMPMISTRRQDYNVALSELRRAFPTFLELAPEHAVAAMSEAVEAHVSRKRALGEPDDDVRFMFHGVEARISVDYSSIWDHEGSYPGEYAIELLDETESFISRLVESDGDSNELRQHVHSLAHHARLAVVWRRLLHLGVRHPKTLGVLLQPLLCADPILTGVDTTTTAGQLIQATAPHLPSGDREQIECAIMRIPENACKSRRGDMELVRDRLLGCFGEVDLVTEAASARLEVLRAGDSIPRNVDDRPRFRAFSRAPDEEEILARQGVPIDDPPNRRIQKLEKPVEQFVSNHTKAVADSRAVLSALPRLKALKEALASADADGVHPVLAARAWNVLARACSAVAAASDLDDVDTAEGFAREVLLEASRHPQPEPSPNADIQFIDPYWYEPAVRINAALGLLTLAVRSAETHPDVAAALDALMTDPVPSVRYRLAVTLHSLHRHAPDRFWFMLESMVRSEMSPGVARGLLEWPLKAAQYKDPDQVATLTLELYGRFSEGPGSEAVRNAAVSIFAELYVMLGHAAAGSTIATIHDRLPEHLDEAADLVSRFRKVLVLGPTDRVDPDAEAKRRRAIDLVLRITRAAAEVFETRVAEANATAEPSQDREAVDEQLKTLAHLLDNVARNLWFISGADRGDEETESPEVAVQRRLLNEAGPIIDELADIGLAPIAHHLLESLEALIPCDPVGVFRRVATVIRGGRKGSYQHDGLAKKTMVRIVERYLADYRTIFQREDEVRHALIEVLDIFVQAGSVEARRLSYGLDEIFR